MNKNLRTVLLASTALGLLFSGSAQAADSTADTLAALQAQITTLQKQIADMQTKDAARAEAEAKAKAEAAANPAPAAQTASSEPGKKEILPGVSVKVGGFIAMEGAYRTKNETADVGTVYRSIPLKNSYNDKTDEFRAGARATRLSLLAEGKPDADTTLNAFVETDFNSSGTTSNSGQTNGYTPRLRHGYATVDRRDLGFYFLGGQAYSLATMNKTGLTARQEMGVQTVDASGPPGYIYTRAPQIRFVKDFDKKKWGVGLSFEAPEVNFGGVTPPSSVVASNKGTSSLNSSADYATTLAPDIIAKVAYDPSFGHYEVFSMTRFFRDVVKVDGDNQYAVGMGIGAGALLPVLPKKMEIVANGMVGKGIGRYSSAQFADIAFDSTGKIKPLTQMTALVGVLGHPTSTLDLYMYASAEKILRKDYGDAALGYGSSARDTSGCYTAGSAAATCSDQAKLIWQLSPGFWQQVYKGDYGNMKVGGQYSLTRKDVFSGSTGAAPHAFENTFMMSFRYAPF